MIHNFHKSIHTVLIAALLLCFNVGAFAAKKPKLIMAIIVDQMRADYITRYRDLFSDGGFKLLLQKGAECTNSSYSYSGTFTGPGHSAILSGITPGINGIISNDWYVSSIDRSYNCVEDSTVRSVGIDPARDEGKMSPHNFHGTALGDELKRLSSSSKSIGISIKNRAAILPAGMHPDGAYWFEATTGRWITSTYYASSLPGWVDKFDRKRLPNTYLGKKWKKLLPENAYARSGKDNASGEGILSGESLPVFPHNVKKGKGKNYESILPTPYGNDLTLAFAEAAINGEYLGQRGVTDMLSVSLSSTDYCGHIFGPHSHEMEDIILRLDRQLESFFHFVDARIGLDNVIIVVTADHGACPLPEEHVVKDAARLESDRYLKSARKSAGVEFHYDENAEKIIRAFSNDYFYLDTVKLHRMNIPVSSFENTIVRAMITMDYVARCYTRGEIEKYIARGAADDSLLSRIANSYNPERSGEVVLVVTPYSFFSDGSTGTTHGTTYWYDRSVPLLFFGEGIAHARYDGECSPLDIEPTIAHVVGFGTPEHCSGKVLAGILRE